MNFNGLAPSSVSNRTSNLHSMPPAACWLSTALLTSSHCLHCCLDDNHGDLDAAGAPIQPAPVDPGDRSTAQPRSLPAKSGGTIETAGEFHNRSTVSSMDTDLPPGQGVSAAADWIAQNAADTPAIAAAAWR